MSEYFIQDNIRKFADRVKEIINSYVCVDYYQSTADLLVREINDLLKEFGGGDDNINRSK